MERGRPRRLSPAPLRWLAGSDADLGGIAIGRTVVIPYRPREAQKRLHAGMSAHRFSCLVCHRRLGKTTGILNQLQREALTLRRPEHVTIRDPIRVGYMAPYRHQAKAIAWEALKRISRPIHDSG